MYLHDLLGQWLPLQTITVTQTVTVTIVTVTVTMVKQTYQLPWLQTVSLSYHGYTLSVTMVTH